jgi:RNA polymerase sigma-70 factor, ECF subfamily
MEMATGGITQEDFDQRYAALFPGLTQLARALGAADEAEDLAQEVLMEGRRRVATLRDGEKLEAWLRRIMVRSAHRLRQRRTTVALEDTVVFVPLDPAGSVDLQRAIARLPPREHLALALVYGLGYSQAEAADTMGITRSGVAALILKARVRLVRILAADG